MPFYQGVERKRRKSTRPGTKTFAAPGCHAAFTTDPRAGKVSLATDQCFLDGTLLDRAAVAGSAASGLTVTEIARPRLGPGHLGPPERGLPCSSRSYLCNFSSPVHSILSGRRPTRHSQPTRRRFGRHRSLTPHSRGAQSSSATGMNVATRFTASGAISCSRSSSASMR